MRGAHFFLSLCVLAACGSSPEPDAGSTDLGPHDGAIFDAAGPDGAHCRDADGDGHGDIACGGDDCDDADPNRYPTNAELCDSIDQDCNPATLGPDSDGDGFPASTCCNPRASGGPLCGDDCDDTRATVGPTAVESCNGVDDDCNGSVDEGIVVSDYYPDCDGDGFGDAAASATHACATPVGAPTACTVSGGVWSTVPSDCRDDHAEIHPGAAAPCGCGGTPWDADADGFVAAMCGGDDCDDSAATAHPGGTETCNGIDDDCDGALDFPLSSGTCVECGLHSACGSEGCCVDAGSFSCGSCGPFSGDDYACDGDEDCVPSHRCLVYRSGTFHDGTGVTGSTCGSGGISSDACHVDADCPPGRTCHTATSPTPAPVRYCD